MKYVVTGEMAAFHDGVKIKGEIIEVVKSSPAQLRRDVLRNVKAGLIVKYKKPKEIKSEE